MNDIKSLPVNKKRCHTCPFSNNQQLAADVISRNLENMSSQICHATEGENRTPQSLCRGHRDILLNLFHGMGYLTEPTDEAWDTLRKKLKV